MSADVWNCGAEWYDSHMHDKLWQWLLRFIRKRNINSIVEVGGGYGPVHTCVDRYVGIERNGSVLEEARRMFAGPSYIHDDWIGLDFSKYPELHAPQFDLFLSLAVVEHCPGYSLFIRKAMALNPRLIVISFFRGLSGAKQNRIMQKESKDTEWSMAGGVYWDNQYCQRGLVKWMEAQYPERDWYLTWLGEDVVLVIEME